MVKETKNINQRIEDIARKRYCQFVEAYQELSEEFLEEFGEQSFLILLDKLKYYFNLENEIKEN